MSSQSTTEVALSTAAEISEQLDGAGVRLETPPDTARLIVRTLRRLAEGHPFPMKEIAQLASDLENAKEALEFIDQMSEKDEKGNVLGHLGLSLNDHPHQLEVDGRELHAWCAWDTLFLPLFLGRPAHVTSNDPATGKEIRLTVSPDRVERSQPEHIVVSVVVPDVEEGHTWTAEQAQVLFCNFIHFFADAKAASQWFAERNMPVSFLTVEDAVELGRIRFKEIIAQS